MSFDDVKLRRSTTSTKGDVSTHVGRASGEISVGNVPHLRDISHRSDDEEHDSNCETCRDFVTPYPNGWSKYR